MTVDTLSEKLQKFKEDGAGKAEVRMHDRNGEAVLFILQLVNDDSRVWLECENDVDMENEIRTRFDDAIENGMDELDVYSDMLKTGIDVDMVRKYMGNDVANHMKKFCEEHGLL